MQTPLASAFHITRYVYLTGHHPKLQTVVVEVSSPAGDSSLACAQRAKRICGDIWNRSETITVRNETLNTVFEGPFRVNMVYIGQNSKYLACITQHMLMLRVALMCVQASLYVMQVPSLVTLHFLHAGQDSSTMMRVTVCGWEPQPHTPAEPPTRSFVTSRRSPEMVGVE